MRILLIDPWGEQKGVNVGLAYLSAALTRAGIEHRVLDMVNGPPDPNNVHILDAAYEFRNDCIGISIKTSTYRHAKYFIGVLKSHYPEATIIAGGPHATLYGDNLLDEIREIDAVIAGEAEQTLPELLKALDKPKNIPEIGGVIFRGKDVINAIPCAFPTDLDDLPFPYFDRFVGLKLSEHHYPLVTSRGCPHACIYCSVGKVSGRKWRARSPWNVIAELEHARKKWGITEFDILDDTFTQDVDRANEICRLMIERGLNLGWSCPNGIRADRVTPDLVENMVRAGCHTVIFGVETGNPELFASLKKGEKLSDIEHAARMSKTAGLRVGGYFIIGLPGDTYEGTLANLDYARNIGLDWAHFNLLAPYPGTKVWEMIEQQGRFLEDWRTTRHFGQNPRPIFELNGYSADEMVRAYFAVHVKQKLYHLVLPANLTAKKQKREIRRLRIKYDYLSWKSDVGKDLKELAAVPSAAIAVAAHEAALRMPKLKPKLVSQTKPRRENLRVLMVNDHGGAAGGAEKYIIDVTRELERNGAAVAWAYDESADWSGIDTKRYHVHGLWKPAPINATRQDLEDAVKDFNPDVIHIHNVQNHKVMNICAGLAPTIRTVHDHNITCPSMNRMYATGGICALPAGWACMDRLLDGGCAVVGKRHLTLMSRLKKVIDGLLSLNRLNKVLTASEFMRSELVVNGLNPSRVESLPLFVDFPDQFAPPDGELPLRILWVGRMVSPDKGPDVFIDALAHIKSPFEAVMAGAGPAKDFARRKAEELKLSSKVRFAGLLTNEQIERQYQWCHVVVFTSVWAEPFGYVGVEAAAHARPVVAFDVGAVREWLSEGEGGYTVPRNHSRSMAIRIDRLARDPKLRHRMGLGHRHYAETRYNKSRHIERLLQIYSEVIGN